MSLFLSKRYLYLTVPGVDCKSKEVAPGSIAISLGVHPSVSAQSYKRKMFYVLLESGEVVLTYLLDEHWDEL